MKQVKLNQNEMDFMNELQALLDKYNARVSTTTRGYGEYETHHLDFVLYKNKPVVGQCNEYSKFTVDGVLMCHDAPVNTKYK